MGARFENIEPFDEFDIVLEDNAGKSCLKDYDFNEVQNIEQLVDMRALLSNLPT